MTTRSRFSTAEDSLHAGRRHGERLLHQDVQIGRERRLNMGLVEMGRRADDDSIERRIAQQLLDVVEGVFHPEALGQSPGLGRSVSQIAWTSTCAFS